MDMLLIVVGMPYLVIVEHTEIEFSGDLKVAMHASRFSVIQIEKQ